MHGSTFVVYTSAWISTCCQTSSLVLLSTALVLTCRLEWIADKSIDAYYEGPNQPENKTDPNYPTTWTRGHSLRIFPATP